MRKQANYAVILLVQTFCFRDKAVCREVEQLEVQCNNNEAGCKWVGKLIHYVKVYTCSLWNITLLYYTVNVHEKKCSMLSVVHH